MKGKFSDSLNIELYLKREEFNRIYAYKETIECKLQKFDSSDTGRKVNLQCEDFETISDGIKVEYDPKKRIYLVKMNERAIKEIDVKGQFETRYGMSASIKIYIPEKMNQDAFILL